MSRDNMSQEAIDAMREAEKAAYAEFNEGYAIATWERMTTGQQAALKRISKGLDGIGYYPQLMAEGLIATIDNVDLGFQEGFVLTQLGRAVLAQGEPAPTQAAAVAGGFAIDYETKWFNAASDLSLARLEVDELTRELEETTPQIVVDELRAENAALRSELAAIRGQLEAKEAANGTLKAALEYYANPDLYIAVVTTYNSGDYDLKCDLLYEGGKRATEALAATVVEGE